MINRDELHEIQVVISFTHPLYCDYTFNQLVKQNKHKNLLHKWVNSSSYTVLYSCTDIQDETNERIGKRDQDKNGSE